jgi:hypothetical protein
MPAMKRDPAKRELLDAIRCIFSKSAQTPIRGGIFKKGSLDTASTHAALPKQAGRREPPTSSRAKGVLFHFGPPFSLAHPNAV